MKAKPTTNQIHISGATYQQRLYDASIELLRFAEPPEGYYLSTSFGKDSIVAQRLCDEAGVMYDAHHNLTGIDPPELIWFGKKYYPNVKRIMYSVSMWNLILQRGIPPMRHMRYCCEVLKEDGGIGRVCVMGIRAEESNRRRDSWAPMTVINGKKDKGIRIFDNDDITASIQSCAIRGKLTISPLYHWPKDVLWDFIHDRKMPYCSLYDEGFDRLGCILCPQAREVRRRQQIERWPKYYDAYLRTFQRLIDIGRFSDKGSAALIMEWWLSDKTQKNKSKDKKFLMG